jgi:hypothetical protein
MITRRLSLLLATLFVLSMSFVAPVFLPFLGTSPNTPSWEGEPADPDVGGGPKRR